MKFVSPAQRGTTCRCTWSTTPAPAIRPRFQPRLKPCGPIVCVEHGERRGAQAVDLERLLVVERRRDSRVAERRDHQVAGGVRELVEEHEGALPPMDDEPVLVGSAAPRGRRRSRADRPRSGCTRAAREPRAGACVACIRSWRGVLLDARLSTGPDPPPAHASAYRGNGHAWVTDSSQVRADRSTGPSARRGGEPSSPGETPAPGIASRSSEPAPPAKPGEQGRYDQRARRRPRGRRTTRSSSTWSTIQPKFWPKKPGDERQRQEDRRDQRQLLHHRVEPVRDRRQVDVHRAREQIAVAVDQLVEPDQVVVDVAEVAARPRGRARAAPSRPPASSPNRSRCGHDHPAQPDQAAPHREDLVQLARRSARSSSSSSISSSRSSNSLSAGKKLSTSPSTTR